MEAEKIKYLRKMLGLTQEELATRVGVAYFTVVRWENNMNKPSRLSNNRLEELEKLVLVEDICR